MYNRTVPGLRLQIPYGIVSLNLEICAEYYFKCRHARSGGNAAGEIADLLTSFLENHPLEWQFSSWKNDLIAELVLGWREAGERWLKGYWKRDQKMQRETAAYLSPKRTAASSAVAELELLAFMDKNPKFWIRPGFRVYAAFVSWLNRNWERLAAKKQGPAFLDWVVREFRAKRQDVGFSDSELSPECSSEPHNSSSV